MKKENAWLKISEEKRNDIFDFNDRYIDFLNEVKTEREAVKYIKKELESKGFKDINNISSLSSGDKVYFVNKNKSVYASVIGSNSILNGLNIVGSHIDSPRLDLKPNPLYEDLEQALFKTHYYGGIKKYQWTCIPLSMRGVVVKTNGEVVDFSIGEDEDFTFTITDLLPHLAIKQSEKKLSEAIEAESLNILVGNMPLNEEDNSVKKSVLKILKDKYDVEEKDLLSAELELVPAFKAKSLGFDKSMVAGYGQDDRICSYTNLMALLDINNPKNTCVSIFADKEEIGSMGNTGMMSESFDTFILKLLNFSNIEQYLIKELFCNSKMLSADVGAGIDPNYKDVSEVNNASFIGHGVEINKYTGSRGKSGSSDANAEFVAYVRNIFESNNIPYQVSELGKVDIGGGGTIAYILANKGMDVIDCGVPLLSMHSPYEVSSKIDTYMVYEAYKAFFNN